MDFETLNNRFLCAQLTSFKDNNVPLNLISRETLKRKWLNSIREIEFVQFGGTLSRPKDKIEICQESVNEFEQIFIGLGVSENVYKYITINHNTPTTATQSQSQELFLQDYEREMRSYLSNKQLQEYYIKNLFPKRSRKDKISKNNPSELIETRE